ncbi:MAG: 4-hydroxy-tetrahydrodipicolinate reductase [Polyangia bacterium]|nr:4-hydroxy-tetrahydrodipicolinate reductase [Polyangia bacterium]
MSPGPIGIAISGAGGRMGGHLRRLIAEAPDLRLAGALERPGHPEVGRAFTDDPEVALEGAGVLIDFSLPSALLPLLGAAARRGVAIVSGTTGLDKEALAALDEAARKVPVVWSSNMSLGVNLLFALVEQVARALPLSYDAEIVELHHRHKRDAPSGTALGLLRALRAGRPEGGDSFGRKGELAERPLGEVGVHALRGGEVVGEHQVHLLGPYERLELTHRAQSREAFAQGALQAARWVAGRSAGRYDMRDVLGLR